MTEIQNGYYSVTE